MQGAGPYNVSFFWSRQIGSIVQSEAAECGLCCVASVAAYYGMKTDMSSLRGRFPISSKGSSLSSIIAICERIGLGARAIRLELAELGGLKVPAILHFDMDHYVVLIKRTRNGGALIQDPALGKRRIGPSELSRRFTGVALELQPNRNFSRGGKPTFLTLRSLLSNVRGLRPLVLQIFGLALVLEACVITLPLFVQSVVDQVITLKDAQLLILIAGALLLMLAVQTTISALRNWCLLSLGTKLSLGWSHNVLSHLLRLPEDYYQRRHIGDIVSRFDSIEAIRGVLTTRALAVLMDGLMAMCTLAVISYYSIKMTFVVLAGVVVYGCIRWASHAALRDMNVDLIAAGARQQTQILETIKSSTTIRLNGDQSGAHLRYMARAYETANSTAKTQGLTTVFDSVGSIAVGATRVAVIFIGAQLAIAGSFSAGMLIAFLAYSDQFVNRLTSLVDFVLQLRLLKVHLQRLSDIVFSPQEPFLTSEMALTVESQDLRAEGLSYRYSESESYIFKGLSFDIPAGKIIAIHGPSGCGKTTLVKLLCGVIEPTEGEVLLGGKSLRLLGKEAVRANMSVVMQSDVLMSGTILENISMFQAGITPEDVYDVAKAAEIHVEIMSMPMRYHTFLGDLGGGGISSGQRQRLLLARALFRSPKLILLDEATSHIDPENEIKIFETLRRLGVTVLIVAHRSETLSHADVAVSIPSGVISRSSSISVSGSKQWAERPSLSYVGAQV